MFCLKKPAGFVKDGCFSTEGDVIKGICRHLVWTVCGVNATCGDLDIWQQSLGSSHVPKGLPD
jgi:hypothetical protein